MLGVIIHSHCVRAGARVRIETFVVISIILYTCNENAPPHPLNPAPHGRRHRWRQKKPKPKKQGRQRKIMQTLRALSFKCSKSITMETVKNAMALRKPRRFGEPSEGRHRSTTVNRCHDAWNLSGRKPTIAHRRFVGRWRSVTPD